jgi:DNA-binding ferritin-like protein
METEKTLNLLGTIRCVELIQHTYHLEVMGDYSDHLLLGEIYDSLDELYDSLAERFVCLYGKSSIDKIGVLEYMNMIMQAASKRIEEKKCSDEMECSLEVQSLLLDVYKEYYSLLEENWSKEVIGLANLLQDHIDLIETQIYKLSARCCKLKD